MVENIIPITEQVTVLHTLSLSLPQATARWHYVCCTYPALASLIVFLGVPEEAQPSEFEIKGPHVLLQDLPRVYRHLTRGRGWAAALLCRRRRSPLVNIFVAMGSAWLLGRLGPLRLGCLRFAVRLDDEDVVTEMYRAAHIFLL